MNATTNTHGKALCQHIATVAEETEFEKQAIRLRERRAMIAGQQMAVEEEQELIDIKGKLCGDVELERRRKVHKMKAWKR